MIQIVHPHETKSEKFVLVVKFVVVINFNAVQSWVLNCSPWQKCAVKAKVMMNMFALVVKKSSIVGKQY